MEPIMNNENKNLDLKSQVMDKIKCESVHPHSRSFFKLKEFFIKAVLVVLVMIAAIAVSITAFSLIYGNYALYEITHRSFWLFLMDILPSVWLIIFTLMVLVAIFNVRWMKTGYRYALWKIIGGTLLLSLSTGLALHLFGLGFFLDQKFGHIFSNYDSQENREIKFWQNPNDGRIVVVLNSEISEGASVITVSDIKGGVWRTNIIDLNPHDLELLNNGKKVRMVGQAVKNDTSDFHACGVFPWIFDHEYSRSELQELRDSAKGRFGQINNYDDLTTSPHIKSEICEKLQLMMPRPR
jgi:hypothetical protein